MSNILNKKAVHLVVDIETTGLVETIFTQGGCEILEAAVCMVFWDSTMGVWDVLDPRNVTFPPQHKLADVKTVEWYYSSDENKKNMNDMVIAQANIKGGSHTVFLSMLLSVLTDSITILGNIEPHYWSRGKDFDFTVLNAHAAEKGFEYPWLKCFQNRHCLRDLEYITGIKPEEENKHPHRAATDAHHEAKHLALVLNELERRKC